MMDLHDSIIEAQLQGEKVRTVAKMASKRVPGHLDTGYRIQGPCAGQGQREECVHSSQLLHHESRQDKTLGTDPPGFVAAILTLDLERGGSALGGKELPLTFRLTAELSKPECSP